MGNLTSIYNFVPLNEKVYYPSWADMVSQDIPFSDGEDGIIEVDLRNVSPLFTRNGSADRNSSESNYSAHVKVGNERLYYLPATSIKGMLRATMEVMSFAKLTQYTDRYFGYRDFATKSKYLTLMKHVRPGWLRMESDGTLYITPCDGEYERIEDSVIDELYPHALDAKNGWERNVAVKGKAGGKMYPLYLNNSGKKYRIVCTGYIDKKKKEFLFPLGRLAEKKVSSDVATAFKTIYEPSPKIEKVMKHLEEGEELAVFYYYKDDEYDIRAIGLSSMIRFPYKKNVGEIINNQQKCERNRKDLVETIFGYVSDSTSDSCKGRVQVQNAFMPAPLPDGKLLNDVRGVQGQPKASFFPFYLKQQHNPYKTYDDADGIAGRKLYRIHKGGTVTNLPEGNGNDNTITNFKPIPAGQVFHLRIAVHNLRKMEIGALLSALTLHKTEGVWHSLGLARGFGYGKLEIVRDSLKLKGDFKYQADDYLKEFESQMSQFTKNYTHDHVSWLQTKHVIKLMSILSEHDDRDLEVMSLEQYNLARKKFGLIENSVKTKYVIKSLLSKKEIRKKQWLADTDNQLKLKEAAQLIAENNYKKAIIIYKELIDDLIKRELDKSDVEGLLSKANDWYVSYKNKKIDHVKKMFVEITEPKKITELKAEAQSLLADDYSEELEKIVRACDKKIADLKKQEGLYDDLYNNYNVNAFKILNDRTKSYLKKTKETELDDRDKKTYSQKFRDLYPDQCHPKKENGSLANKNSKIWENAKKYLGNRFDELLGELYKAL